MSAIDNIQNEDVGAPTSDDKLDDEYMKNIPKYVTINSAGMRDRARVSVSGGPRGANNYVLNTSAVLLSSLVVCAFFAQLLLIYLLTGICHNLR
jgi:hypothetical protein